MKERASDSERDVDVDEDSVVHNDTDGPWLTVVDTVAELLLDSDELSD